MYLAAQLLHGRFPSHFVFRARQRSQLAHKATLLPLLVRLPPPGAMLASLLLLTSIVDNRRHEIKDSTLHDVKWVVYSDFFDRKNKIYGLLLKQELHPHHTTPINMGLVQITMV